MGERESLTEKESESERRERERERARNRLRKKDEKPADVRPKTAISSFSQILRVDRKI